MCEMFAKMQNGKFKKVVIVLILKVICFDDNIFYMAKTFVWKEGKNGVCNTKLSYLRRYC